jgi:hypothetical protein
MSWRAVDTARPAVHLLMPDNVDAEVEMDVEVEN